MQTQEGEPALTLTSGEHYNISSLWEAKQGTGSNGNLQANSYK